MRVSEAALLLSGYLCFGNIALADNAELHSAWAAASKAAILGPVEIKLLDQAKLQLPADEAFIPAKEADAVLQASGNGTDSSTYGLILSRNPQAHWDIIVRWVKEGYVRDGDAKDWQPDALLQSLRSGNDQTNLDRAKRGLPEFDIIGWIAPPIYDNKTHRLVWSLSGRDRDDPANEPQTINYNTYALGREGYFSLNLVTGSDTIDTDKSAVRQLLGTLTYDQGKRYEDFDQSTDKVAAYGLAALIGVVAVKKLGLLAVASLFLLKIWKVGLLALAGIASMAKRMFNRQGRPRGPS